MGSIIIDTNGSVYTLGNPSSTVAKYSSGGTNLWIKSYSKSVYNAGKSILVIPIPVKI